MAKKKATAQTAEETLEDLAELAGKLNIPEDALDGDLRDACRVEADFLFSKLSQAVTWEKLEFLYQHGYELGRLKELIEEAAKGE